MTENKSKRKDIVKNVAIVFLAVLLGLTFFSNTIMNWSLPEVSGQYAGYGTITSSIRASGTVAANQGYSVTIAETREIKNVLIRKGDKVEAGQVIFTLEEGDSSELEAAREELDDMEYQYKLALINSGDNSYSGLELDLAELKEDLADAQKKLDGLQEYGDTEGIEAALEEAQKGVKACEEHIYDDQQVYFLVLHPQRQVFVIALETIVIGAVVGVEQVVIIVDCRFKEIARALVKPRGALWILLVEHILGFLLVGGIAEYGGDPQLLSRVRLHLFFEFVIIQLRHRN